MFRIRFLVAALVTTLLVATQLPQSPLNVWEGFVSPSEAALYNTQISSRSRPFLDCGGGAYCNPGGHWDGNGAVAPTVILDGLVGGQVIHGTAGGSVEFGNGGASCAAGNGQNAIPKQVLIGQFGKYVNNQFIVVPYPAGPSGAVLLGWAAAGITVPAGATHLYASVPDSRYDDNSGSCSFTNVTVTGGAASSSAQAQQIDYGMTLTGPATVSPATTYNYSFASTKSGPGLFWGVRVVTSGPAGTVINVPDPNNICTGQNTNQVTCTSPAVQRSASNTGGTNTFSIRTPATCPGGQFVISETATVLGTTDSNPGNNQTQAVSTWSCGASSSSAGPSTLDYGITLSGPSLAHANDTLTYILGTSKSGPATVWGATEVVHFVPGSTVVSVNNDPNHRCQVSGSDVTCIHPIVTRTGTEGSIGFTVRAPASFTCDAGFTVTADATTQGAADSNLSNNHAETSGYFQCAASSSSNPPPPAQCQDGLDNDGDGATDMADFSCQNSGGTSETNPKAACQDGIDNDNDTRADAQDPGCHDDGNPNNPASYNRQDNSEFNPQIACSDGQDNDGDGFIDIADPGCHDDGNPNNPASYNFIDNDEFNTVQSSSSSAHSSSSSVFHAQCSDGADNDNDGLIDAQDPGCYTKGFYSPNDNDEANHVDSSSSSSAQPLPQCRDGIDNDNDGATDYPADFSCSGPNDDSESQPLAQCQNGIDDDGDGLADYPQDPGCQSRQDNNEFNAASSSSSSSVFRAQCGDGFDNDNDGLIDTQDPGCYTNGFYNPNDNDETNQASSSSSSTTSSSSAGTPSFFVQKTDNRSSVQPGETLTYTITIVNLSGVNASGVTVTDPLSGQLSFVSASDGGFLNSSVVTWQNLFIPAYSTRVLTVSALVKSDATGTITNTAYINGQGTGGTDTTVISGGNTNVNLNVTVNAPVQINAGGTLTYGITIVNNGQGNATNVMLNDYFASGLTFLSSSDGSCTLQGQGVVCTLGGLSAGQSRQITLVFLANGQSGSYCVPSTLISNVTVHADQAVANGGSATSTTSLQCPNAQLTLSKTDDRVTAAPGEQLNYTIVIHNASGVQANGVTVSDTLPYQLSFLSASDGGSISGQTVTWPNLTVPAYGDRTLTVGARISGSAVTGVIVNTAQLQGNGIAVQATASDATTILTPLPPPSYGGQGGGYVNAQNDANQYGIQSNTSTVNAPVTGDGNTVAITTVQQNQTQQYLIAQQQLQPEDDSKTPPEQIVMLPKTGAGDRTGPLENVTRFLLPVSAGQAAVPAVLWSSMILMAMAGAAKAGRRFYL
jgi:uncharacterized repeat protein (TIGR01451 family)